MKQAFLHKVCDALTAAAVAGFRALIWAEKAVFFRTGRRGRDALDYVSWRESYWNPGLIKMQAKNIAQKVRRAVEKAMEEAEDFCRQNCTGVYELAYMFSNGEAGYNKVA